MGSGPSLFTSLYESYTLFYIVGTYGAMLTPVVGWTPLESLEQIMPLAVFVVMQIVIVADRFDLGQALVEHDLMKDLKAKLAKSETVSKLTEKAKEQMRNVIPPKMWPDWLEKSPNGKQLTRSASKDKLSRKESKMNQYQAV